MPYKMKLRPEILQQDRIMGIFFGINPRNLMGETLWNIERQKVYKSTDYHCICCGVHKSKAKIHQWLEAHEVWKTDHATGICEITEIIPLCYCCHNFIHSGRLYMVTGKERDIEKARFVLEHGFKILAENKLKCPAYPLTFGASINCDTYGLEVLEKEKICIDVELTDYVLLFEGKKYRLKLGNLPSKYDNDKDCIVIKKIINGKPVF